MTQRRQNERRVERRAEGPSSFIIGFIIGATMGYHMTRSSLESGLVPALPILATSLAAPGVMMIGPQNVPPMIIAFLAGFGAGTVYAGFTMTPHPFLPAQKDVYDRAPRP